MDLNYIKYILLRNICNERGDITTGLQAWWRFDEGSGSTAIDSSSNANTGTLTNSPTYSKGRIGKYCLNFLSSGTQYVNCGTGSTIANLQSSPATFSFWINPASVANMAILARNDGNSVNAGWQIFAYNSTSFFITYIAEAATTNLKAWSGTGISTSGWTHAAVVIDGTQTAANQKFYINGVLATTQNHADGSGTVGSDSTQTFYIGNVTFSDSFFGANLIDMNGKLDDIRVYTRGLSVSDIQQLYNYGRLSIRKTITPNGTRIGSRQVHWGKTN